MAEKLSKTTTDHEQIRRWVEERGGSPAEVIATGDGETGIIRIDFPGYTGEGKLRRISWEEWFDKFDRSSLAFLYEEVTSGGQRSNFNKLIARETAEARSEGRRTSRREMKGEGRYAGGRGRSRRAGARARKSEPARGRGQPSGRGGRRAEKAGRGGRGAGRTSRGSRSSRAGGRGGAAAGLRQASRGLRQAARTIARGSKRGAGSRGRGSRPSGRGGSRGGRSSRRSRSR